MCVFSSMIESRDDSLRAYSQRPLPSLETRGDLYFTSHFSSPLSATSRHDQHFPLGALVISSSTSSLYICLVCFNERKGISHLSTSCRNTFGISVSSSDCGDRQNITRGVCHNCIDLYLTSAIDSARVSGDGSIKCICPSRSCPLRYDREFVLSRLSRREVTLQKYERFVRNASVAESKNLRWCPREGCGNIVTVSAVAGSRQQRSQCERCSLSFCSSCGNPHPALTPCSMGMEEDFMEWKQTTASGGGCRKCPSCRMFIEKDGGCRHVTCAHCHYEFCWHCKAEWLISGCSSGPMGCAMRWFWKHPLWGSNVLRRGVTKTLSLPLVATAAGVGVGVGIGVGVLCSPLLAVWWVQRYKRKRWRRSSSPHSPGPGPAAISAE